MSQGHTTGGELGVHPTESDLDPVILTKKPVVLRLWPPDQQCPHHYLGT